MSLISEKKIFIKKNEIVQKSTKLCLLGKTDKLYDFKDALIEILEGCMPDGSRWFF